MALSRLMKSGTIAAVAAVVLGLPVWLAAQSPVDVPGTALSFAEADGAPLCPDPSRLLIDQNAGLTLACAANGLTATLSLAIVPGANGGLGATQPNCPGGAITCNGTVCSCLATPIPTVSVTPTPQVFDVTAYGATGDGTTDDTTAIRSAVSAAVSNGSGVVYFPCGTYIVTKPAENGAIKIDASNLTLRGASRDCAVLTYPNTTTDAAIIAICESGSPTCDNVTVRDLTFDGNGANWSATGTHYAIVRGTVGTSNHGRIDNILVKNFSNATNTSKNPIQIDRLWNDWAVTNSVFLGNERGINIACNGTTACKGAVVANNYFDQTGASGTSTDDYNIQTSGLAAAPLSDVQISGNVCRGSCHGRCITSNGQNVIIERNTADSCAADQIIATRSTTAAALLNVTVANNVAANGSDGGFGFEAQSTMAGCVGCSFVGNVAKNNAVAGLYLVDTTDVTISGNVFDGNGSADNAGTDAGIFFSSPVSGVGITNTVIIGNTFTDRAGTPTQKYHIQIPVPTIGVTGTVIEGNQYGPNQAGGTPITIANSSLVTLTTIREGGHLGVGFTNLSASYNRATNGSTLYCTDCTNTNPCAGSGNGAIAQRINGAWACNGGAPTPVATATPSAADQLAISTAAGAQSFTAVTDSTGAGQVSQYNTTTHAFGTHTLADADVPDGLSLDAEVFSTAATVTAGTNAQGQGALTKDLNVVTTASSNPSGVTLPTATVGRHITIINKGANSINVYPASGGTIDALSANVALAVPVGRVLRFNASSTTQWYSSANELFTTPTPTVTSTPAYLAVPAPTTLPTPDCVAGGIGRMVVDGDGTDGRTLYVCTDLGASYCIGGTNGGATCSTGTQCPSGYCSQYAYLQQANVRVSQGTAPGYRCERLDLSNEFSISNPVGSTYGVCTIAAGSTLQRVGSALQPAQIPQNIQPTPDTYKLFGPSGSEIEVGFASQKRCRGGTNAHGNCSADSACPGGGTCVQVLWINNAVVWGDDGLMVGDGGIRAAELSTDVTSRTSVWNMDGNSTDLGNYSMAPRLFNESQDRTITAVCFRANANGATIALRRDLPCAGSTACAVGATPTTVINTPTAAATPGAVQTNAGCVTGLSIAWPKGQAIAASYTGTAGVTRSSVEIVWQLTP